MSEGTSVSLRSIVVSNKWIPVEFENLDCSLDRYEFEIRAFTVIPLESVKQNEGVKYADGETVMTVTFERKGPSAPFTFTSKMYVLLFVFAVMLMNGMLILLRVYYTESKAVNVQHKAAAQPFIRFPKK